MHVTSAYVTTLVFSCVTGQQNINWLITKGSFTKLEWDRLEGLLQIRPFKRTKQEKDAQAKISLADSLFQDFDDTATDAASIPKTHPDHKNLK